MELPSEMTTAQAHPDAQAQLNSEAQTELFPEQNQFDETITDLTVLGDGVAEGSAGGNNLDPNLATDAEGHSEEA